jgi:hypothetical protein
MALDLHVTFTGTVGPEVASLTVNGAPVTLSGRAYTVTVPATSGLVVLRTVAVNGTETVRHISLMATPMAAA